MQFLLYCRTFLYTFYKISLEVGFYYFCKSEYNARVICGSQRMFSHYTWLCRRGQTEVKCLLKRKASVFDEAICAVQRVLIAVSDKMWMCADLNQHHLLLWTLMRRRLEMFFTHMETVTIMRAKQQCANSFTDTPAVCWLCCIARFKCLIDFIK